MHSDALAAGLVVLIFFIWSRRNQAVASAVAAAVAQVSADFRVELDQRFAALQAVNVQVAQGSVAGPAAASVARVSGDVPSPAFADRVFLAELKRQMLELPAADRAGVWSSIYPGVPVPAELEA